MPSEAPKAVIEWYFFHCPHCRVKLRLKAAYAHLRGRCPECGRRIEAPRPLANPPPPPRARRNDDLPGLVPVEDEWPEPARPEIPEDLSPYLLGTSPLTWPQDVPAPEPEPLAPGQTYDLATGPAPPPSEEQMFLEEGYRAHLPEATMPVAPALTAHAEALERPQIKIPPPPELPLVTGIYTFPWRKENLVRWLILSADLAVLFVQACLLVLLFEAGGLALLAMVILIPPLAIGSFLTSCFAAAGFLNIIEETAAGADDCTWPEMGVEWLNAWFYMLWLTICCGVTGFFFWGVAGESLDLDLGPASWLVWLVPAVVLFPAILLSSLAAGSWWVLVDWRVIKGLLFKAHLLPMVYVPALAMVLPCLWFTFLAIGDINFWLAAGMGVACASCFLIYARLLGRVGWVLTGGGLKKKRKKRKKPSGPSIFI